jgi:oxygen-independent coproporphyrinogen-3 oxidase
MTAVTSSATTPAQEPLVGNYYVAAYPPFSAWQPAQIPALEAALQQPASAAPLGLYLHVPFCQKKCDYCYYLSYVDQNAATVNRYLEAVVAELSGYASLPAVQGRRVSFVYFGGGTFDLELVPVPLLADGLCGSLSGTAWRK